MNYKRLGRTLICLLLVCVLLVNVSPIRAEASVPGVLLGPIAGAASVSVPVGLVVGAATIALGLYAKDNSETFLEFIDSASEHFTYFADNVKDGCVELLQVVDDFGNKAYYIAADVLNDLKGLFDTAGLPEFRYSDTVIIDNVAWKATSEDPFNFYCVRCCNGSNYYFCLSTIYDARVYLQNGTQTQTLYLRKGVSGTNYGWTNLSFTPSNSIYLGACQKGYCSNLDKCVDYVLQDAVNQGFGSSLDWMAVGNYPSVPIDGSSALDWSEEYASKRIYVTGGSNDPDPPDENNGKWFWPIALPLTAATLLAMSQADEWSGETPQEFDQYTQNTEFEILNRPEFDGYQAIEIAPVTNPNPNPNPDVGENPDIGGDSDTDSEAEKTWFQRIVKGIEELPSKFGSWLDKILEWLQKIWEAIITLPETIAEWIADVLQWAFAPSETFIQSKVETLIAKYPTADTFFNLGNSLGAFFGGLGAVPPIIYIDLGAAEGSYLLGGREVFLDLTWYSRYKPTVDAIIGAFIWLWLAWRVFLSIPSIIHGEAGTWGDRKTDIGAANTSGATIVHQRELPSGKR